MIELILVIAVVGLIVWAIVTLVPMPQPFKTAIIVVAILCLAIYVLRAFGFSGGGDIPVPRLNR